ncbi:B-cadherin-like isoform X2 [Platichthys flesus]|nr:B-cadherin-like isoform X2 [Platichthys flesus]
MAVTDADEPHSPAWNAKFTIVDGDPGGLFTVTTGSNKQEGIITTAKGPDFEMLRNHILLVAVENDIPFATPLPTATATVVVNVQDVNEAPVFEPVEKFVSKRENLPVDSDVVQYTASDRTLHPNRKSYEVLATGTGTLIIQLEDVNENAPIIEERTIKVCNKESAPQLLSVTDKDGPGFAAPYSVSLQGMSKNNWTARRNDSKTGIVLNLVTELESGEYTVVLRLRDNDGMEQDNTVQATVCDCTGKVVSCSGQIAIGTSLPMILGTLGGVLWLLMLLMLQVLLLRLMFARRRG